MNWAAMSRRSWPMTAPSASIENDAVVWNNKGNALNDLKRYAGGAGRL